MKANAEHEQNHADLCELPSHLAIGHESRSRWADAHSRDEIADQRRQTQTNCNEAECKCQCETDRDRRD